MDTLSSGLEECLHQIFKVDFDFSKIEDRCSPLGLPSPSLQVPENSWAVLFCQSVGVL